MRLTNNLHFLDYCRSNVRGTVLAVVQFGFANFRIQLGPDEIVYASTASIRYAFSCRQLRVAPEYTVCKFSAYSVPLTVRNHLTTAYVRLKPCFLLNHDLFRPIVHFKLFSPFSIAMAP